MRIDFRLHALVLALTLPCIELSAQGGRNEKIFFSPIKVEAARQNPKAADYLYFVPDENFVRGYSEVSATQRFGSDGLAGFLQKPYTSDVLAATLEEVIEERGRDGGES